MAHNGTWLAAAAVVLTAGCRLPIDRQSDAAVPPEHPDFAQVVQVRYLGVSGFLIRRGEDVVLTAPLYSNPDLFEQLALPVYPDAARIRRFHPPGAPAPDAILVGHPHYDHVLDVPYVWQLQPGGTIYGSATLKNILAPYNGQGRPPFPSPVPALPPDKVIALDATVDTRNCAGLVPSQGAAGKECARWPSQAGEWVQVTPTLRIRALCARHPEQVPGYHQGPGCVNAPLGTLPESATDDYLEGPTLTYLIDFLDGPQGAPAFRVYFQDVPTDGRLGQVPDDLIAERPVDLALLCVGNWNLVDAHDAQAIVRNIRPQHVLLGHWENFFKPQDQPLEAAPLQPVGEYHDIVERELGALACPSPPTLSLPAPQVLKVFRPAPTTCALR